MVIRLQIGKLHSRAKFRPPVLLDSEKPGLFRVKDSSVQVMTVLGWGLLLINQYTFTTKV